MEKSLDVQGKGALFIAEYAANIDDFAVDVVFAGAVPHFEQSPSCVVRRREQ